MPLTNIVAALEEDCLGLEETDETSRIAYVLGPTE